MLFTFINTIYDLSYVIHNHILISVYEWSLVATMTALEEKAKVKVLSLCVHMADQANNAAHKHLHTGQAGFKTAAVT